MTVSDLSLPALPLFFISQRPTLGLTMFDRLLNMKGIEKNMKLELFHTEPSRMALLNYGNTSSSSIWYEMEYIQEYQKTNPLKKGHRIMQVAFGSGFKCTSGVWLKL